MLNLRSDGENFFLNSVLNEFPTISIQQASDCFRMGGFINQFRQVCGSETQSNVSANTSNTDYCSIDSLSSAKDDTADPNRQYDHCDDDNIVCGISVQDDKT